MARSKFICDADVLPSDTRISLRGLLLVMAAAAVVAALVGPQVRRLVHDEQWRFFVVFGILFAIFLLTAALHVWLRRRAEREAGPVFCQLSPASNVFPHAPHLTTIAEGLVCLAFDFVVLGAAGLVVVEIGWYGWPALFVAAFFYVFSGRGFAPDGIAKLWWGGRIRICQRGIVTAQHFVSWRECDGYYWDPDQPNKLVLYWLGTYRNDGIDNPLVRRKRPWQMTAAAKIGGRLVAFVPDEKRLVLEKLLEDVVRKPSGFTHEIARPAGKESRE